MPTTALPSPHVGTELANRYVLIRHIARGGMADVYAADDRLLEREVAVKVFRSASPADRARFDAEVRVLAGLDHPGLVRVFDAGAHGLDAFVVLELIDGPTVAAQLSERGTLPSEEAAVLGVAISDALDHIHEQGVVHRDVTPANVLCGPDGRPRLVDFGIARLLDTARITATSVAVGTVAYMAPEQLQGHDVTPAADVYALGVVLLEALTGQRAFEGSMQEMATSRLVQDPDTSGVPGAWRPLLERMVARDPAARPTAREVQDQLEGIRAAATMATGPFPVPAAAAAVVAAPSGPVDLTAATQAVPVEGTAVMPAAALPIALAAEPAEARSRVPLLLGAAAVAVVVLVAVAAAGDDPGIDPSGVTDTTAEVVENTDPPATTVAPVTNPPTTVAPLVDLPGPQDGEGPRGKERKDRGKDDEGDD